MKIWRHIRSGLWALLHRAEADRDLADEIQSWVAEAEAELVAGGATPEEARREVRLRYGDGLAAREEVRSYGWEHTVATIGSDLRVAARRLSRSPGFTAVAVLTLGLGIGATTAIYSAVGPILFEPLPYPEAGRIVSVSNRSSEGSPVQVAFGTHLELAARGTAFEALTVFKPWQPTLTGADQPERLTGQRVSAAYFDVLGVAPALGRDFEADADRPGGPDVVVLGDGLWRRRFDADRTIVGRIVYLDSTPFTVVGVMPPDFENVTAPRAEAWALLQYDPSAASFDSREWGHHLDMLGRTRAGVGLEEARTALTSIAERPTPEFVRPTWASMARGFTVSSLKDAATAVARPTMLVLLGAVALLLGIASVNVTILLLARGARRRGELAMRFALGASRTRVVSYLLTESLVLAAVGGVVGLAVARLGFTGLVAVSPPSLSQLDGARMDAGALLFALGLTTLVCVIFGLAPALVQSGRESPGGVRSAGGSARGRRGHARQNLVATEVAVAVILLVGAGLLLRSTQRVFSIPSGFDPSGTVVLQVSTTGLDRGDRATQHFFDDALAAIEELPGVTAAAVTSQLPLTGDIDVYGLTLDEVGRPVGSDGPVYRYAVSPDYFRAMGIERVRGRGLEPQDVGGATPVVVVSESLAARLSPDRDPIGARFHIGAPAEQPFTVVGVVADVKQASLGAQDLDAVYVASEQWHWADRVRWFVVHSGGDPESLVPAVRGAIRTVDGNQPIVRVQSMADVVALSEAQRRFVLFVLAAFAVCALVLASVGLFGVLSGSVTERMREIGVRGALGASQGDIVTLVLRTGMRMTALGTALGVSAAAVASDALVSLLFGVSRLDPVTYLAVIALLAFVSVLACWIPAARAANVDPVAMLRAD